MSYQEYIWHHKLEYRRILLRKNGMSETSVKQSLVIIPCYNEEETIVAVITSSKKYVNNVLVIDDGSKDNTTDLARKAALLSFPIKKI